MSTKDHTASTDEETDDYPQNVHTTELDYDPEALVATFGENVGIYDNRDRENRSERHFPEVRPRFFLHEHGYDILDHGERIPSYLGQTLIKTHAKEKLVLMHSPQGEGAYDDCERVHDLLLRDGFTQMEFYRIDGETEGQKSDSYVPAGLADGGYLIRYAVATHQDKPVIEENHDHIGYFVLDDMGVHKLLNLLLNRDEDTRDRTLTDYPDSEHFPTRNWMVARVDESGYTRFLGGTRGQEVRENALFTDENGDAEWVSELNRK